MTTISLNIKDPNKLSILLSMFKEFDYLNIKPISKKQEKTAKEEHEELKEIFFINSKRFLTKHLDK